MHRLIKVQTSVLDVRGTDIPGHVRTRRVPGIPKASVGDLNHGAQWPGEGRPLGKPLVANGIAQPPSTLGDNVRAIVRLVHVMNEIDDAALLGDRREEQLLCQEPVLFPAVSAGSCRSRGFSPDLPPDWRLAHDQVQKLRDRLVAIDYEQRELARHKGAVEV